MFAQLDRELGRLAVARGLVTEEEVGDCLRAGSQAAVPMNLAQVMLLRGIATQQQIDSLVATLSATTDFPAAASARLGVGARFGRYEILAELGRGGMGAVYKTRDMMLDRVVALKVLSDRTIASDEDVHRFRRESKLAARIRHPHLVEIYEAGLIEGVPYFTMEFVEGRTLDDILVEESTSVGGLAGGLRLSREDKIRIMMKTAQAIHHVHRAGVIHRDVKPGNIIIDVCKEPHVMDFGLAREIRSGTMLTSTGTAMGTPYYMAPEQAAGDVHNLDARTDVYALGAVLYHALTLKLPFTEVSAAVVLRRVIEDDPIAPRQLDPTIDLALEWIVGKAMAKGRRERYASAGELARDLERYLAGAPISARGPSLAGRARRWLVRHPTPATAMAVAGVLLSFFVLYLFFRPGRLTLHTTPGGAEVFIDGDPAGRTPVETQLARGRHAVRMRKPGYRELAFEVDVAGGRSELRREQLEERAGRVTLESEPSPAEVRLTGAKRLTLQTPVGTLTLPEGEYRAEVFRAQYELQSLTLKVDDRADVACRVSLREAQRWQFRALDGVYRAPVLEDLNGDGGLDVIVATRDGRVVALSGSDGRVLWSHESRVPSPTDIAVGHGHVYVGVGATGFVCLRGTDGAVRYFVKTGHRTFVACGPTDDVVTATWDGTVARWNGSALAALRPEKRWIVQLRADAAGSSPARVQGIEEACEPEVAWRVRLEGGRTAVVSDDGTTRWVESPPPAFVVDESGTVTAAAGLEPAWRFRADQSVRGMPIAVDVDGDAAAEVVFGADDQRLYVLDGRTGALRWTFQAGGNIAASVAAADLTGDGLPEIVFGTTDGVVRAVSVASR
ncbi:MAG: protein kinase [Planctomycetes bacterium]|nr:protein kinase [Planctomycetota bacterium]